MDATFDLRLFARVVELKSFSAAADEFGVSRALVSKKMTQLENQLSSQLINRSTRSINTTEAGKVFYQYCCEINRLTTAAEESLKAINQEISGSIKIAVPNLLSREVFCPALPELMERYPDLKITIDNSDQFVDVIEGGYDLLFRPGTLPDSRLIAKRLADLRIVTCAAPSYWQNHKMPSHPADLKEHNCLIYSPLKSGQRWAFHYDDHDIEVPVSGTIAANDDQPLTVAALAGLGVYYAPRFMVRQWLKSGELVEVLREFEPKHNAIYAVYPQSKLQPEKVKVVMAFFAEKIHAICQLANEV